MNHPNSNYADIRSAGVHKENLEYDSKRHAKYANNAPARIKSGKYNPGAELDNKYQRRHEFESSRNDQRTAGELRRASKDKLNKLSAKESFSLFDYNPQFDDYEDYDDVEEASGVTYGPVRKVSKPTRRYYTEDGRRVYPDESDNIKRNDVTYGPARKVSVPTGRYYTEDGRRVYPAKAKEGCKTREGCSAKEDAFGLFEDYDEYDVDSYDNYDDYEDFE